MCLFSKPILLTLMLGSLVFSLTACENSTDNSYITSELPSTSEQATVRATVKSSAGIHMSHSFDGDVSAGGIEAFDITFEVTEAADTIDVEIVSPDAILVGGDIAASQSLTDPAIFVVPVEIQPLEDGEYYLHVVAHAKMGISISSRAFAIAIRVGDISAAPPPEDGLIVMPAEETVN